MNGGRLSNDETFLLGVGELRGQLNSPAPNQEVAERALNRIAVRYPEEAEQLRGLWLTASAKRDEVLDAIEAQHRAESDED
ncbi:MAG TPA: hypothetical protein VNE83_00095 [Terriglobales bacterium]|nr:hypothetical protein [Terriglobales bacterium]